MFSIHITGTHAQGRTAFYMKELLFMFNPWWGKIIGALIGYLAYGPAGAVFGIICGNLFDIGLNHVLHTPQWHYYRQAPTETRNMFMPALFKIMGNLAKTDGVVTQDDIKIARQIMRELKLMGQDKKRAMQYYNEGKSAYFKMEPHLGVIKQMCYHNSDLRALFAETLYRTALISTISNAKKDKLNTIFMTLAFKPVFPERVKYSNYYHQTYNNRAQAEHAQKRHSSNHKQSQDRKRYYYQAQRTQTRKKSDYEILGVQEGERAAVVKKAYRKIMSQVHPDKLIAKGASQVEIDKATDKAQEIQAAYERIKKARGF